MREVERTQWVRATPTELDRVLSPATVVDWEGSFDVRDVEDTDDGTVVTAGGPGVEFRMRFEDRPNGYYYEQVGDGPFDYMETWLAFESDDDGSSVHARSSVALGVRLPFVDRVAAWKRGGELGRLLDRIDDEA